MPDSTTAPASGDVSSGPSTTRRVSLAHVSDIHFGAIADMRIVDALVDEINGASVDVVCVSGDLTQRARRREFADARAMIDRFTAPVIVVPGNHDVYAWWRPLRRLFRPLRRYQRLVSDDLTPSFVSGGGALAVLGINSAHGQTRKGGRIGSSMRAAMQAFFGVQEGGAFKVLVLHHHLVRVAALGSHDVSRKATRTLSVARGLGVDLILCGHLHISHVEPVEAVGTARRVVIASAGTATSTRGRRQHKQTNFYNLIRVAPDAFEIDERRFSRETGRFETTQTRHFDR